MESVTGEVDSLGRALVRLRVRREQHAEEHDLTAWVDTGFTGELVVPRQLIAKFNFPPSTSVMAELADGKQVLMDTFFCIVEWFGEQKVVEVIESEKGFPLLGVGLLVGRRLSVDYRARTLTIE
jgi:clan AA aspartic protease